MFALLCFADALALDASHYAQNSVLSDGRWMKVKASATGMHLITNADLKAMGFSDPARVHVYGTGGRMVREALTADMPDDLPLLPSVQTSKGIVFFATDCHTWSEAASGLYTHSLNPYNSESLYFVSDRDVETAAIPAAPTATASNGTSTSSFISRQVYERDIQAPSQEGRLLLGEDFRTEKSQKFSFNLTDIASQNVTTRVAFGAKTTNGSSSILITANGERLPATAADRIDPCKEEFIKTIASTKTFSMQGDKLTLGIEYSYSGALFTARLDYIEVFYTREMRLADGELHFYKRFEGESVRVEGCSPSTRIWDVTDPCRVAEVSYTLSGSAATFTPAPGYREYVAFEPNAIARSAVRGTRVANQNIHGKESPDMVIVAYSEYAAAAAKIAGLHEEVDGFKVEIVTPEAVYNEFSGGHADVGAFRKMLKMWHDRGGEHPIRYCLLLGRGSYDTKMVSSGVRGAGYKPIPLWQSPTGFTEASAFSTDDIIGMLDDCDETSFSISAAQMQVAVGRLPVRNATEAGEIADKLEKYIKNPSYGTWRNRVMLIADDQDEGKHLQQTEDVYARLSSNAPAYQYEKLYLDAYPRVSSSVGMTYPQAKERMLRLFNEGVIYTNYVGHASTTSWTHEKLLTWTDINSFSNKNLTFFYGATCSFGCWDGDNVSGAEKLVLNPSAGFIGAICPSRTVYITENGYLNLYMSDWMLTGSDSQGVIRIGDTFVRAKNSYVNENKLRYCLISDPALRLPRPSANVEIHTLNGVELSSAIDYPELNALSAATVTGVVTAPDGSPISDFNGTITLDLYDAERVVETNGNGEHGKVDTYNDRQTKLSSASAKVVNGQWSATLRLPAEIDNNYSPARINAYAWSDKGTEAHGATESLYVFGYDDNEAADKTGPQIKYLYLNYPEFTEGMMVNANPVVHAAVVDESGINISESGIGHRMSVTLDGDKVFDDVYIYYASDPDNDLGGFISYPLSGLSSGEHTLKLTVYDNANNASSKTLNFSVGALKDPVIRNLSTNVNPASTSVVFNIEVDRPNTAIKCLLEVFELSGRRVWSSDTNITSDMNGTMQTRWNLCDAAGRRVPRGIYLYRATVETPEGLYNSQTKKLAVTAQ